MMKAVKGPEEGHLVLEPMGPVVTEVDAEEAEEKKEG